MKFGPTVLIISFLVVPVARVAGVKGLRSSGGRRAEDDHVRDLLHYSSPQEQQRRKVIKVGKNDNPGTPRNGSDPCDEAKDENGRKIFNGGQLNKICLEADLCTYFYGYTEYECECDVSVFCDDISNVNEDNACLPGYTYIRDLTKAGFWTCDEPK